MTRKGFTDYWLAGGQTWASKSGAACEIDLELASAMHALHVRECTLAAYAGERTLAADHRDLADLLAKIVRDQSAFRPSPLTGEAA